MTLLYLFSTLTLLTAPLITFDQLPSRSFDGEHVQIRGFAYQTSNREWVLSSDPCLKSCCIGSHSKTHEQVRLSGDFHDLPKGQAIIMEGNLQTSRTNKHTLHIMTHAHQAPTPSFPWMSMAAGSIFLISGIWLITKMKSKTRG